MSGRFFGLGAWLHKPYRGGALSGPDCWAFCCSLRRCSTICRPISSRASLCPFRQNNSTCSLLLLGSVSGVAPKSLIPAIALSNSELASAAVGAAQLHQLTEVRLCCRSSGSSQIDPERS
jgi:hypothetical protein